MTIESIVVFILLLGVLVLFHEWGHFVAARLSGMRVEEFAFGFGPRLLRLFRRGDTEYTIHALPLGGFVKLAGMEPGQEDIADGFQAQSAWKRAFVIFSGPFTSLLLGAAVFILLGVIWGYPFGLQNQVGQVFPKSEAARIGLRAGDRILSIDGTPIKHGVDMISLIHNKPGEPVTLVVQRNHKTLTVTGVPRWQVRFLDASWSFMAGDRAEVQDELAPKTRGARVLQPNDVLMKVNGRDIRSGQQLVDAIEQNDGKPVELELLRGGKHVAVRVAPDVQWVEYLGVRWAFPGAYMETEGKIEPNSPAGRLKLKLGDRLVSINGHKIKTPTQMISAVKAAGTAPADLVMKGDEKSRKVTASGSQTTPRVGYYDAIGLLGFAPAPSLKRTSFQESFKRGIQITIGSAQQIVKTLTSSKRLAEDVGGPVLIARQTAQSVALGPYWVLLELGMLSLSLAVINLIPIPVLDGGHLAIILVESVRRKRLTAQQMATVQAVGLVIVFTLVLVVLFSDLSKIAGGQVPQ